MRFIVTSGIASAEARKPCSASRLTDISFSTAAEKSRRVWAICLSSCCETPGKEHMFQLPTCAGDVDSRPGSRYRFEREPVHGILGDWPYSSAIDQLRQLFICRECVVGFVISARANLSRSVQPGVSWQRRGCAS